MSKSKLQESMREHPPWSEFDFHPMALTKKLSEGEIEDSEAEPESLHPVTELHFVLPSN